jgi:hypothetical protein
VRSGQELRTLAVGESVRSVAISPDCRQIAASGVSGTVRIWAIAPSATTTHLRRAERPGLDARTEAAAETSDREALGLVINLMERGLKSQARDHVHSDPTINLSVRQAALNVLATYPLDEFASRAGHRFANASDWPAAAEAFARACEALPADFENWYLCALCELKGGRTHRYRRVCREMFDRFKYDDRPYCLDRLLSACLLVSKSGISIADLRPIAARLEIQFRSRTLRSNCLTDTPLRLALFDLRRGDARAAEKRIIDGSVYQSAEWYFEMAVIQTSLGRSDLARLHLLSGVQAHTTDMHPWYSRAVYDILRDEAQPAINNELGPETDSRSR